MKKSVNPFFVALFVSILLLTSCDQIVEFAKQIIPDAGPEYNAEKERQIAEENKKKSKEKEGEGTSNKPPKYEFDSNYIAYVYIINDSKATAINAGHNFIAFQDANKNGKVYSYGPVVSYMDYHARMWTGTFSDFENKIKQLGFSLLAKRLTVIDSTKKITAGIHWKNEFNKYDYYYGEEYIYGTEYQPFDRYVKFSITTEEGKKMIDYADLYLTNHPQYGVLVPGKKVGQCDNMTSEIAGAGGLGYKVWNTPNASFNAIVDWGGIGNGKNKRKFIEKYPK